MMAEKNVNADADITGQKEIIGYIHRVSPLKNSKTPYFDCLFQTKTASRTRMVCFYKDYLPQFKELSRKKTPVKVAQFRTSTKFGKLDIIVDKRTQVSEGAEKLPFKPATGLDFKENVDICTISELANMQTVTIKGKLCQVSGTKKAATHFGELKQQTGFIVDTTASIRIVFWERFTDVVQEGKTYWFKNVTVKKNSRETYVNTARTGSSIEECEAFKTPLAIPEDFPGLSVQTMQAHLVGVNSVSKYRSCGSCSKKLQIEDHGIVQCEYCKLHQNPVQCQVRWFFKGLFVNIANNDEKLQLSVFHQHVEKIVSCFEATDLQSISEEEFIKKFLEVDVLQISYDIVKKVVTDMEVVPSTSVGKSELKRKVK